VNACPVVHTLHPGDLALATQGEQMDTLLGSCVAIVLTDPRRTVGVMCHIVHSGPASSAAARKTAHANAALAGMYRLLHNKAIAPRLCEAYVYGGGNMFPYLLPSSSVGDDNARWVFEALAADGIPVLAYGVGGAVYRRLRWTVGPEAPQVTEVPV